MDAKTLKKMPTTLQAWIMAVRPRTIPIPTIQVLSGVSLAYAYSGKIDWDLAFFTWLVALCITIGTNLINDVFDFDKGGDLRNRVGHVKAIRAGWISRSQVYTGGVVVFAIAILCAVPLALKMGWSMMLVVALSVLCGYCYTGGPFPICYLGLSELFILIFYGGVCIVSTFYVQTGLVNWGVCLASVQMGLLAIIPNALNNFRDMFEDAQIQKRTLAVRFGKQFARREIALATFIPFIINPLWIFFFPEAAFFPFLLVPLAFLFVRSIWITEPGPVFNRYFGLSVLIHFLFGVMLLTGWLLG